MEGISDEILSKTAKHTRNKSDTFAQPSSAGDGSSPEGDPASQFEANLQDFYAVAGEFSVGFCSSFAAEEPRGVRSPENDIVFDMLAGEDRAKACFSEGRGS